MDAYANDFQKIFLAKNPYDCNHSRSNRSYCKGSEPFSFLINRKDIKDQILKIKTKTSLLRLLKDVSLI